MNERQLIDAVTAAGAEIEQQKRSRRPRQPKRAPPAPVLVFNDSHRCANCGRRFMDHAGNTNPFGAYRCPGETEPKYPQGIADEKKAGEEFKRQYATYWSERSTTFRPRT